MKNGVLLALTLALALASVSQASDCTSLIDNCIYYLCRETEHPCGQEGYFVHFSYGYCSEFEQDGKTEMTEDGNQWLGRVAQCLRDEVEKIPVQTSCSTLETEAFASHKNCYVNTGFCKIPLNDKLKVIQTVYREAVTPAIDRTFIEILEACAHED